MGRVNRILKRLRRKPLEDVRLGGESIGSYREFWDHSATVDAENAVACGVADIWDSGRAELEMLKPYLAADAKVLEIGCGIGRIMVHVAPHCDELCGVDISGEMLKQAAAHLQAFDNVRLAQGDGFDLPLPDASFDFMYSCRVFQHVPKNVVLNYLKEAHRVLKPGSKFALQIPNILLDEHMLALNHFATRTYFKEPYPMFFYTPDEVVRLGTFVGFEVEVVNDWLLAILTKPVTG